MSADPSIVVDLIEAFRRSKTMFTAVSFGIFDRLEQGESDAETLAAELQVQADPLRRLLEGCCGLGLLETDGRMFRNAEVSSRYLVRESPDTLAGYVLYSDSVLYGLWGNLRDAVIEGGPRWKQTFGLEGGIFNHFFRTEAAKATFLAGMNGFGRLSSPAIVRVFNLNAFRHLVDLGGGPGHLCIAACERYANLRATLFDLPGVLQYAEPRVRASRASDRISLSGGDFFTDALPEADLYAVSRILHDWSEARIRLLLQRIHAALSPGGALLVCEALLDEDGAGPLRAQMQSLNMLVCTEGKERRESEYRELLEAAGFHRVEARRTGTVLDAILAYKK